MSHPKAHSKASRPLSLMAVPVLTLLSASHVVAQTESTLQPGGLPPGGTIYKFKHLQTGARQLRGGVFPGEIALRPARPSVITRAPDGHPKLRFGTVRLPVDLHGTPDDVLNGVPRGAALEEPSPTNPSIRFWVDFDGDGDLTNNHVSPDTQVHAYAKDKSGLLAQMNHVSTGTVEIAGQGRNYVVGRLKGSDHFLICLGKAWPDRQRPESFDLSRSIGLLVECPPTISEAPEGVREPRMGVLLLGDRASPRRYLTVLDLPPKGSPGAPRLFVDSDADGTFNEPAIEMKKADAKPSTKSKEGEAAAALDRWTCTATVALQHAKAGEAPPTQTLAQTLVDFQLDVRLDPAADLPPDALTLTYRGEWGRVGLIRVRERNYQTKECKALLFDELSMGDYRGSLGGNDSGVRLLVDLNNNGTFERGEAFDPSKPFEMGSFRYRIENLEPSGESFRLICE